MRTRGREIARTAAASLRWLLAGTLVATAHGAAVWLAVEWQPHEAAASEPPPAMMIELAPLAVTPDIVPIQSVASADSTPDEQPETPPEPEAEPPRPEPVKPPETVPPPEAPKPVLPERPAEPMPPEPVKPPEPIQPKAEPAPTMPDPLPAPEPPKTPEPPKVEPRPEPPKETPPKVTPPEPPKQEPPKAEAPKFEPPKAKPARTAEPARPKKSVERKAAARPKSVAAPRSADAKGAKATKSAAPVSGAGQASVSPASWKSRLLAHLNRHKRFPRGASAGTASVAFSIDRLGRVISARLANSSGDGRLDDEAVSLVRRSSPVPAPPEGFGGGRISLTVPVRFSR